MRFFENLVVAHFFGPPYDEFQVLFRANLSDFVRFALLIFIIVYYFYRCITMMTMQHISPIQFRIVGARV